MKTNMTKNIEKKKVLKSLNEHRQMNQNEQKITTVTHHFVHKKYHNKHHFFMGLNCVPSNISADVFINDEQLYTSAPPSTSSNLAELLESFNISG